MIDHADPEALRLLTARVDALQALGRKARSFAKALTDDYASMADLHHAACKYSGAYDALEEHQWAEAEAEERYDAALDAHHDLRFNVGTEPWTEPGA